MDSLSTKDRNEFKNVQSVADINQLKAQYVNGLIRIQDSNGIINNPEVFEFLLTIIFNINLLKIF